MKFTATLIACALAVASVTSAADVPSDKSDLKGPKDAKTLKADEKSNEQPREPQGSATAVLRLEPNKLGVREVIKNSIPGEDAKKAAETKTKSRETASSDPGVPSNSPLGLLFQDWNSLNWNNGYNFATGKLTNTYAKPGRASNRMIMQLDSCDSIIESVTADGFKKVDKKEVGNYSGDNKRARYFAILLTAEGVEKSKQDWAVARLIKDYEIMDLSKIESRPADTKSVGWYVKPGADKIQTKDFDANDIKPDELEKANLGPFKRVCGYFKSMESII